MRRERTLIARRTEEACVAASAVAVAEVLLCLMKKLSEAGPLEANGPGQEARGQSGFVEVEELERRSQAEEEEALACQVEVVEANHLCSPPF